MAYNARQQSIVLTINLPIAFLRNGELRPYREAIENSGGTENKNMYAIREKLSSGLLEMLTIMRESVIAMSRIQCIIAYGRNGGRAIITEASI